MALAVAIYNHSHQMVNLCVPSMGGFSCSSVDQYGCCEANWGVSILVSSFVFIYYFFVIYLLISVISLVIFAVKKKLSKNQII